MQRVLSFLALSIVGCLIVLLHTSKIDVFAECAATPPPAPPTAFQSWPLKVPRIGTTQHKGQTVPSIVESYFDNANPKDAQNVVIDMHVGDIHAILWYLVLTRSADGSTITIRSSFFTQEDAALILSSEHIVDMPAEDFHKYVLLNW